MDIFRKVAKSLLIVLVIWTVMYLLVWWNPGSLFSQFLELPLDRPYPEETLSLYRRLDALWENIFWVIFLTFVLEVIARVFFEVTTALLLSRFLGSLKSRFKVTGSYRWLRAQHVFWGISIIILVTASDFIPTLLSFCGLVWGLSYVEMSTVLDRMKRYMYVLMDGWEKYNLLYYLVLVGLLIEIMSLVYVSGIWISGVICDTNASWSSGPSLSCPSSLSFLETLYSVMWELILVPIVGFLIVAPIIIMVNVMLLFGTTASVIAFISNKDRDSLKK